jgi:alkylation response protein AidB-like acyl-CoA dehydrogenase
MSCTRTRTKVERLDEIPAGLASAIRGKALAAGLYAANMPAELGGGGLDALSVVLVERELGRASYGPADAGRTAQQHPAGLRGRTARAVPAAGHPR